MADWIGAHGWTTAAIYPPAVYVTETTSLAPYAADHFGFKYVRHGYLNADQSVDEAVFFFEHERPARAFVWLHLFEPHEPYEAGGEPSFGNRDIDRYDQEIVIADAALGRLSRYLEQHRPGAIIIVTADHGEAFGEHGERYHGTNLHDEQIRVPLLIAAPSLRPRVVSEPVQLVDLFPTVIGLMGTPSPPATDGSDLANLLSGKSKEGLAAFAAIGDQRMIVRGKSKIIWDLRQETSHLFDLERDPDELHELGRDQAAQSELLRGELHRWVQARLRGAERLRYSMASPKMPESILRARLGEAAAADLLVDVVARPGVLAIRQEAARLLLQLPPRLSTFSPLIGLQLDDLGLADWVSVAALRLGYRPAQQQVERILTGTTPGFELRLRAAEAMAWRKMGVAAPALLQLLDKCPEFESCRQVIGALGRLGDRSATPALVARLKDPMLQRESIRALGQIAEPEAVAPLVHCLLHDERSLARMEAARALRLFGGPRVRYSLSHAALGDPELAVRAAALQSLMDLKTSGVTSVSASASGLTP